MPEEIVGIIIVIAILTFIATVIRSTQQYKLTRLEKESGAKDDSLTTTELRDMIDNAVNEATASLQAEVAMLSERIGQIEGSAPRLSLDDRDSLGEKTVGRAVRQRER